MTSNAGAAGAIAAVQRSEAEWSAIMAEFGRSGPAQKLWEGARFLSNAVIGIQVMQEWERKTKQENTRS